MYFPSFCGFKLSPPFIMACIFRDIRRAASRPDLLYFEPSVIITTMMTINSHDEMTSLENLEYHFALMLHSKLSHYNPTSLAMTDQLVTGPS